MKNTRRGLGKGMGVGYKNLAPMDSHIHSLSAKGVKSKNKFHTYSKPKSKLYLPLNRSFETDDEMDEFVFEQMNAKGKHSTKDDFFNMLQTKYPDKAFLDIQEFMDEHWQNKASDKENLKMFEEFIDVVYADEVFPSPTKDLTLNAKDVKRIQQRLNEGDKVWIKPIAFDSIGKVEILELGQDYMVIDYYGKKTLMPYSSIQDITSLDAKQFPRYEFIRETQKNRIYKDKLNGGYVTTGRGDNDSYKDDEDMIDRDDMYLGELNAKQKLNILQKVGLQDKPHRGRPVKEEEIVIAWDSFFGDIPSNFRKKDLADQRRKAKFQETTKREKKLGLYNVLGAGVGFVSGTLLGGLGGMLIGVPIGTYTGFALGELTLGKEKGRPPKYTKSKSKFWQDFWIQREEELEYRYQKRKEVAKEKKEAMKNAKKR